MFENIFMFLLKFIYSEKDTKFTKKYFWFERLEFPVQLHTGILPDWTLKE